LGRATLNHLQDLSESRFNGIGLRSLSLCLIAFSGGEPVSTSPENALRNPAFAAEGKILVRGRGRFDSVLNDVFRAQKRIPQADGCAMNRSSGDERMRS
jgi:hypothetical protein